MKKDMIKIGPGYMNKTKAGDNYITVLVNGNTNLMIFKNGFKEADKPTSPDYWCYISEKAKKAGDVSQDSQVNEPGFDPEY